MVIPSQHLLSRYFSKGVTMKVDTFRCSYVGWQLSTKIVNDLLLVEEGKDAKPLHRCIYTMRAVNFSRFVRRRILDS